MAQPFFRGNYGSALGRVDTRPIIEAGRAQGQMYANLGGQIGGMIKEYGLNKQKRAKLTGEIEAYYEQNPEALSQIGMSGDEVQDKKDFTEREKFVKGDMSMAQLEGYAGKLARGEVLRSKKLQDESRMIANQTGEFALGLQKELKDSRVAQAKLTNDLRRLALTEGRAVSPAKIKDILDRYGADAATRPSQVDATIEQNKAIIRSGKAGADREELLGGSTGVAAQELTKEALGIEQMEANIDRTRGLTDALGTQMDLMRNPVDTRISGNTDISKSIDDVTKDIQSILKSSSMERDEDGEPLTIEDLIEDVSLSGEITFSEDANKISAREKIRLQDLLRKKRELQGQAKTTWIDDNGNAQTTTIAEYEEILRKQNEADLEAERLRKQKRLTPFISDAPEGTPSMVDRTYGNPFPL